MCGNEAQDHTVKGILEGNTIYDRARVRDWQNDAVKATFHRSTTGVRWERYVLIASDGTILRDSGDIDLDD